MWLREVLKVEWINPHAWVHVEVEEKGKKTTWMVEGGTPNTLIRNGINKERPALTETYVQVDQSERKYRCINCFYMSSNQLLFTSVMQS